MAAVLVHIDLDGDRPHGASLQALAAGRAVASSWGATLYAAVIAHDPAPGRPDAHDLDARGRGTRVEAIRAALARGGADKIVVAWTTAPIVPLWGALGTAWQGVLDQLRPRLVAFGADAPSAVELGPRTAARIGARLFLRARATRLASPPAAVDDQIEIRDRDGSYVRASDSGAAVVLVGAAPALDPHGDDDIDVMLLAPPGDADPRIELISTTPAELAHTTGTVIAIGDEAARDPEIAAATRRLALTLGAYIVGSASAATTGLIAPGAVVGRNAPLTPDLCIAIGSPAVDIAGSASLVKIGQAAGKGADSALGGPIAAQLLELIRALEER